MTKKLMAFGLIATVLLMFSLNAFSQEQEFKYVGAKKCKMCHSSKKSGEAYPIWEKSKHAQAYATLASDEAKAIGKKMGIDDPQKSDKCLKCHVTGFGKPAKMFEASFSIEEGVECETCHGPGSEYKSMKIMKEIYAGKVDGAKYGLVKPTKEVCVGCHNEESPTFKGFDFAAAAKVIAHPIPKE